MATTKQLGFIDSLLNEIGGETKAKAIATLEANYSSHPEHGRGDQLPVQLASKWIDRLLTIRDQQGSTAKAPAQPRHLSVADYPDIPAGRYAVTGDDGTTDFYQVQHGKGRWEGKLFVKLQTGGDTFNIRVTIAKAILEKIREAGPREAAIRYGHEIGACSCCGRTLTNPESIAAGIGPICASKAGW